MLQQRGHEYVLGKTWTTNGVHRETPAKVRLRTAKGFLTVEVDAAALSAAAQFRRVVLAQLPYGATT